MNRLPPIRSRMRVKYQTPYLKLTTQVIRVTRKVLHRVYRHLIIVTQRSNQHPVTWMYTRQKGMQTLFGGRYIVCVISHCLEFIEWIGLKVTCNTLAIYLV